MKFPNLRFLHVLSFFLLPALCLQAQKLTGIWRGYFITEDGDQYKFELQVDHTGSNRISGVSYSYLDTRFYGKAALTGFFNRSGQSALIQETKTVELRMAGGSVACIMKCQFAYSKSGKEEYLEGTYTSAYEKTSRAQQINKGENCGGGKVFLRKVPTSDFYVEPFLRENPVPKISTPPTANQKVKTPAQKPPINKKATPPKNPTVKNVPVTKPPAKNETVQKPKVNELPKNIPPVVKEEPKNIPLQKTITIPTQTRSRENELLKTLIVTSNEIIVKLYDNGEIDGDTISVYLDDKVVLSNKRLAAAPLTIQVKMDENNPDHVLVMVAENLGTIPPNTSLMIVQDGEKRYEVRLTSTEQKNAMVRFRYQR